MQKCENSVEIEESDIDTEANLTRKTRRDEKYRGIWGGKRNEFFSPLVFILLHDARPFHANLYFHSSNLISINLFSFVSSISTLLRKNGRSLIFSFYNRDVRIRTRSRKLGMSGFGPGPNFYEPRTPLLCNAPARFLRSRIFKGWAASWNLQRTDRVFGHYRLNIDSLGLKIESSLTFIICIIVVIIFLSKFSYFSFRMWSLN